MNSMDNNKLAKFLLGEATSQEREEVLKWISASEENRRVFDEFERTWNEAGKVSPKPLNIDIDAAWEKVAKRTVNKTFKSMSFMRWAVAASVILIMGIVGIIKNLTSTEESEFFANNTSEILSDSLPDGSVIMLSSNSNITYSFDAKTKTRKADLSGSAFFEVKRDVSQKFIVDAKIGGVQVLGTSFSVKKQKNEDLQVDVKTGVVKLYKPTESGDTIFLTITEGESGLISAQIDTIIRLEQAVDAFFEINQSLSFNNVPLDSVFAVLSSCYNMSIVTENEDIGKFKLTSNFKNESIQSIIEVIANTFNLICIDNGDTIILRNEDKQE